MDVPDLPVLAGPPIGIFSGSTEPTHGLHHADFTDALVKDMLRRVSDLLQTGGLDQERAGLLNYYWRLARAGNPVYQHLWSAEDQDAFLASRGYIASGSGGPLMTLLDRTVDRFVSGVCRYNERSMVLEQLSFLAEVTVEDCSKLLRGLDNPAD